MSLIVDLCESRLFPSKKNLNRENFESLSEAAYLMLLALRICLAEPNASVWGEWYLRKTFKAKSFKTWKSDGTDIYVILWALTSGASDDWPTVSEDHFVRWFRNQISGSPTESETRRMLIRMDQILRVKDPSKRAMRRLTMDWPKLSKYEKKLVMTRLLQMIRAHHPRAEILPHIAKLAKTNGLEIPNAYNPETGEGGETTERLSVGKPKQPKKKLNVLGNLAAFAAGAATGYHLVKEDDGGAGASTTSADVATLVMPVGAVQRRIPTKRKKKTVSEAVFSPRRERYNFPKAGPMVNGFTVRDDIPNLSSIYASSEEPIVLPGVREIPMSIFGDLKIDKPSKRVIDLATQIIENKSINPLIVMVDSHNGPYILEGSHRFDALILLKAKSFPALVVLDNDDEFFDDEVDDGKDEEDTVHHHPDQPRLL